MITRRALIATTATLALTGALPASETPATVTLRITWTGGAKTQVDYVTVPATPAPQVGRVEFGDGVECLVEVV